MSLRWLSVGRIRLKPQPKKNQLKTKSKEMTTTTEDGGRQNLFAKEPKMYIDEGSLPHNEKAKRPMAAWQC